MCVFLCMSTCADTDDYVSVRADLSVLCPQLPRDNIQFARKPPDFVRGRSSTRLLPGLPRAPSTPARRKDSVPYRLLYRIIIA